jgi:hypothetical protein
LFVLQSSLALPVDMPDHTFVPGCLNTTRTVYLGFSTLDIPALSELLLNTTLHFWGIQVACSAFVTTASSGKPLPQLPARVREPGEAHIPQLQEADSERLVG